MINIERINDDWYATVSNSWAWGDSAVSALQQLEINYWNGIYSKEEIEERDKIAEEYSVFFGW